MELFVVESLVTVKRVPIQYYTQVRSYTMYI